MCSIGTNVRTGLGFCVEITYVIYSVYVLSVSLGCQWVVHWCCFVSCSNEPWFIFFSLFYYTTLLKRIKAIKLIFFNQPMYLYIALIMKSTEKVHRTSAFYFKAEKKSNFTNMTRTSGIQSPHLNWFKAWGGGGFWGTFWKGWHRPYSVAPHQVTLLGTAKVGTTQLSNVTVLSVCANVWLAVALMMCCIYILGIVSL